MKRVYSARENGSRIEPKGMREDELTSNKATAKRESDSRMVEEVKRMHDEGVGKGLLRNLLICPKRTSFETQNDDEMILIMARRHLATNIGWVILVFGLMLVPLVWGEFPLIALMNQEVRFGVTSLWYLGLSLFAFQKILLWFYNVYIVTDERVVDIDFFGLLYKNINVTQIKNIEDVNYSQVGLMSSIFDFGNVVVETAAEQLSDDMSKEQSAFTFESVSKPDRVARVIMQLMEQEEEESYEGRVK